MQNQINTNPESPDTVTIHAATPQFIIGPGGVVNLTGLVSSENSSKATGIEMHIGQALGFYALVGIHHFKKGLLENKGKILSATLVFFGITGKKNFMRQNNLKKGDTAKFTAVLPFKS